MKANNNCKMIHANPQATLISALSRYQFSTPEIRLLMRQLIGYSVSGRTIKRLVRSAGRQMKRGRPPTTPRVHKGDVSDLIEATSNGLEGFNGNTLQFFHQIQLQFNLTPRQYLKWVAKCFRRGKCMMRRCLLCGGFFPSLDSGERHCQRCQLNRQRLLRQDEQSIIP